jgi:LmbE family N-acetylglucosaminyl deacetylase
VPLVPRSLPNSFLSADSHRFPRPILAIFLAATCLFPAHGQRVISGEIEIRQALERLNNLGSVMMIAAHPDDENTALLAYFARGKHLRTAYLSLTRGEGGQNLIGSDQSDELGIIRTQELLAARKIDGGEQFFTRAIDFGFTKTVAETFSKWPREKVLADVVWNIRRFRPDVIILRFSGTPRDGHGQHQVSAIVGREAFTAAADRTKFPEQLALGVEPWQAKRLMYNVATFTAQQEREAAQEKDRLEVDLGEYSPELGYSYGEIAGMSRSQHRSQGMGAAERKGAMKNYLVTLAGDRPSKDVFEGIDTSWTRVKGGEAARDVLAQAPGQFVAAHPEQLIPLLEKARAVVAKIDDPLARRKLAELDDTIALCAGVAVEVNTDKFQVAPGGNVKVTFTALARLTTPVALMDVQVSSSRGPTADARPIAPAVLVRNQTHQYSSTISFSDQEPYSQPYWLEQPKDGWLYTVRDPRLIGLPQNPPVLGATFKLKIAGQEIHVNRPVEHHYVDRVYGELIRPLAVVPPVALDLSLKPIVFPDTKPRRVDVPVQASTGPASGELHLEAPTGWHVEPASRHFELGAVDQQTTLAFDVTPPSAEARGNLRAIADINGRKIAANTEFIRYPHIPAQTLFPPAEAALVRAQIQTLAHKIGYITGAGDEVPAALEQIGIEVNLLSPADLSRGDLARFDAIVTGVRSFNTRDDLRANYQRLYDYVQNGGTLVVQYNVLEGGMFGGNPKFLEHIGPYPITISRDRVTVEEAPVTFPHPELPLLHKPNEITPHDFEGWVQERGLYFASEWDPKYQTVLDCHDPDEAAMPGGELYVRYGKGAYIFTAYSWFRELPAGVPGAYRLFANLLSAGKVQ